MITIILGAPGTGKGTISDCLVKEYDFKHISTGNIFKKITQQDSPLGKRVLEIIASGKLVDDKTTAEVLIAGLADYNLQKDNIILDGYPRNINQANFLEDYLAKNNLPLGKVVNLEVPEKDLIERLSSRISCPKCGRSYSKLPGVYKPQIEWLCDDDQTTLVQRPDDAIEKVQVRLEVFYNQTFPLVKHYEQKNNLVNFDAATISSKLLATKIKELNGTN